MSEGEGGPGRSMEGEGGGSRALEEGEGGPGRSTKEEGVGGRALEEREEGTGMRLEGVEGVEGVMCLKEFEKAGLVLEYPETACGWKLTLLSSGTLKTPLSGFKDPLVLT